MKKIGNKYSENTFENIKNIDEYGNEFWYARDISNKVRSAKRITCS